LQRTGEISSLSLDLLHYLTEIIRWAVYAQQEVLTDFFESIPSMINEIERSTKDARKTIARIRKDTV